MSTELHLKRALPVVCDAHLSGRKYDCLLGHKPGRIERMKLVAPEIEDYCIRHTTPLAPLYDDLKTVTIAKTRAPQMQVGPLEGRFLRLLVALSGARSILELGTFTGYSAMAMAEALPDDGILITCDIDPRATEIAREFWARSPHGAKIQLRLGPALKSLEDMADQRFDLVFIDADKANYINYWEATLPKVRTGGLIAVDNVLWDGEVLEPNDESARRIVAFNTHARQDPRVETVMLPIRDGLLLARKL